MPQVIRCPHCTKSMQVPDNVAGKTVKCPSCQKPFAVPGVAPSARPPSSPDMGNGAKVSAPAPTKCPACGSQLLEGAVACMDCGYLLQSESAEPEAPPIICPNPSCGVANPPGEKTCGR